VSESSSVAARSLLLGFSIAYSIRSQSSNVRWVCCWRDVVPIRRRTKRGQTVGRRFFRCDRADLWSDTFKNDGSTLANLPASDTQRVSLRSPVRANRTPGSVRGALGNRRPYLDISSPRHGRGRALFQRPIFQNLLRHQTNEIQDIGG
jgi:hypothetical protein